jgi:quinol monooxygenase YgiN
MCGLIGKIKALSGQRDTLISILMNGISSMLGCLSYIVSQDQTDRIIISTGTKD